MTAPSYRLPIRRTTSPVATTAHTTLIAALLHRPTLLILSVLYAGITATAARTPWTVAMCVLLLAYLGLRLRSSARATRISRTARR